MADAGRITLADVADFSLGDLLVKPSTRQIVRKDGVTEILEPRVMQVLIALNRAGGNVVRRDELTASCWDDRIVGEDAINRVISRLRRVGEGIGRDSFRVETITKVGYRLQSPTLPAGGKSAPVSSRRWPGGRFRLGYLASAMIVALTLAVLAYLMIGRRPHVASAELPRDGIATTLFLKARDDLAQRSQGSLARSVAELKRVTQIEPDFAPAYASLADAYLLEQEAGSLPDEVAFGRAEQAAERARTLDRDLPAIYRALGFIAYWRDGDRAKSGTLFRRALSSDDSDSLTHFWFANILADNGQDADAMHEFDRARLLDPGSENIATDMAWADWLAGRDATARNQLAGIVAAHPDNAEARDCLGMVLLADGDYRGYLGALSARARLRGEPGLLARASNLNMVMARDGVPGLRSAMLRDALREQDGVPSPDHAEAAFLASIAGDRPALVSVLRLANRNREQWGSAGYRLRIASRWKGDRQVIDLLARLRAPLIA